MIVNERGDTLSEALDRAVVCEFCGVLAHVHHKPDCVDPDFLTDRHTAAERQAEGIADILRERNEYREMVMGDAYLYGLQQANEALQQDNDALRDALAALVAAWDTASFENGGAWEDALAAARKVLP